MYYDIKMNRNVPGRTACFFQIVQILNDYQMYCLQSAIGSLRIDYTK